MLYHEAMSTLVNYPASLCCTVLSAVLCRVRGSAAPVLVLALFVMLGSIFYPLPGVAAQNLPTSLPEQVEITPSTVPVAPEPVEVRLYPPSRDVADWETLEPGLELGRFLGGPSTSDRPLEIVVLRIDPARFEFSIHSASDPATQPPVAGLSLSLRDWAAHNKLVAVINAGMYLPDGMTNTGYLRVGEHFNNDRVVNRFGAFFVTRPRMAADATGTLLPGAALLDRTNATWEDWLPRYDMVVQNYRLISANRKNLWQAGGPEHSIAAIGTDNAGRILFIHCREPLTGLNLGRLLLEMPVDIRTVMYVEGGGQAGLLVDTPALSQIWMGRHPADFWTDGNVNAPLPNVIGVRRKASTSPMP